jgi:hypothetical protein
MQACSGEHMSRLMFIVIGRLSKSLVDLTRYYLSLSPITSRETTFDPLRNLAVVLVFFASGTKDSLLLPVCTSNRE